MFEGRVHLWDLEVVPFGESNLIWYGGVTHGELSEIYPDRIAKFYWRKFFSKSHKPDKEGLLKPVIEKRLSMGIHNLITEATIHETCHGIGPTGINDFEIKYICEVLLL